ncbi:hypothetical protein [Prochlorococcus marinus]|uniref:Uncharacterized protein n=1 Tax=Prochlorococcus marinus (strain MIT 9303) TaxID=59922 RepID=A2C9N1_PROM3|nr:hypothetical protein [Prochlorococcus marinus]ABM78191.1 conserved hypothetical protein [Prochlorococcus marinus str. MIT 9303]
MTRLQKYLLLPCLSPLLAVVVVAVSISTNLSTYGYELAISNLDTSGWMVLGSSAGHFALTTSLSIPLSRDPLRDHFHQGVREASPNTSTTWQRNWQAANDERSQSRTKHDENPERDLRDPSPTVAVPFRVVRRSSVRRQTHVEKSPQRQPVESNVPHRYSSTENDSWGDSLSEDW